MKKFLLFALALVACSRNPPPATSEAPPSASSAQAAEGWAALRPFQNTTTAATELLQLAAGVALRSGAALDASTAERCLSAEGGRPEIRGLCLLLWAGSGESSAVLEAALLASDPTSRLNATALALRSSLAAQLPWQALLTLLNTLSDDSPWLRARLVAGWWEKNSPPPADEVARLEPALLPSAGSLPEDWAGALPLLFRLRPGAWHSAITNHCDARATGELRIRCWRLLAALTLAPLSTEMRDALSPYYPDYGSEDWVLFRRSFPTLSSRLIPRI